MDKVTPEYVAGFMDGEGTIQLYQQTWRNYQRGTVHFGTQIVCNVGNTNLVVLKAIQDVYGGNLVATKKGKFEISSNPKPFWMLYFRLNESKRLLDAIEPFLLIKQNKAREVLAYINSRKHDSHTLKLVQEGS